MIHLNPEQQDDEIFIGNRDSRNPDLGWKTKRVGNVAIDQATGRPVPGLFPVFMKSTELQEAVNDPKNARQKESWTLALKLRRLPLYGSSCLLSDDLEEVMLAAKFHVGVRNEMGGAMYWNISNDDACLCARHAMSLGGDRKVLGELIGEGNYR